MYFHAGWVSVFCVCDLHCVQPLLVTTVSCLVDGVVQARIKVTGLPSRAALHSTGRECLLPCEPLSAVLQISQILLFVRPFTTWLSVTLVICSARCRSDDDVYGRIKYVCTALMQQSNHTEDYLSPTFEAQTVLIIAAVHRGSARCHPSADERWPSNGPRTAAAPSRGTGGRSRRPRPFHQNTLLAQATNRTLCAPQDPQHCRSRFVSASSTAIRTSTADIKRRPDYSSHSTIEMAGYGRSGVSQWRRINDRKGGGMGNSECRQMMIWRVNRWSMRRAVQPRRRSFIQRVDPIEPATIMNRPTSGAETRANMSQRPSKNAQLSNGAHGPKSVGTPLRLHVLRRANYDTIMVQGKQPPTITHPHSLPAMHGTPTDVPISSER